MREANLAYYEKRALQDAEAAAAAEQPGVAAAHQLLASGYEDHVRELISCQRIADSADHLEMIDG